MFFPKRILLCGGILLAANACPAAAPKIDLERLKPVSAGETIPIQDFFRHRLWRQPKLNPSGTHIAGMVQTEGDNYQLLIHELKTQKSQGVGGTGDKDIYDFSWLDDRRLVFFLSSEKLYGLGMFAVEVGRVREAYPLLQYCGARLIAIPQKDRLFPLVWLSRDSLEHDRDAGVAIVNSGVKSGRFINLMAAGAQPKDWTDARENNRRHVIERYPLPSGGIVYHYMADREGRLALAFTSDRGALGLHRLAAGGGWETCPIDLETTDIVDAGDKPDEVLASMTGEPGQPQTLRYLNLTTGAPGETLVADKDYDFKGWVYRDAGSRQIAGVMYERGGPRSIWFDEGFRAVQKAVNDIFPGQVARIIGNSEKGALFLIATFSDRHPIAYHWVDLEKRSASLIKNTMPWIDPARMQPMQILKYKTRDGRQLDAYVTLPQGASKEKPAPLIVLPHGGPWARDTWGFDGEVQFLASRGYAVMQPNYRGSPGYDWMFPIEDRWEFRKMHDDVTDATHMLLGTGLVDPTRVAIMGVSFGAYLALSGVAHEPSLYRCAVTIAGVFDWATVLQERKYDQYTDPSYARMLRLLGDPKKQTEKFDAISPLRHVAKVRVPVFVAHGKEDPVAAVAESRRLIDELEEHKVPHEKLFISGEGHGMGHLKNQVELYSQIEAFLAKNLAPLAAMETPAQAGATK